MQLRYFSSHPQVFPAMIAGASPDAAPGNLVSVFDRDGRPFGAGLWNPQARVPLRLIRHGAEPADERMLTDALTSAIDLRVRVLDLPARSEAFRVVNSDGDGLGGLIVDRYGDTLSIEVHSLGIHQRLPGWLPVLRERLGTRRARVVVDPVIARLEGIPVAAPEGLPPIRFREHDVRFEVDFEKGHKTGFFCDQRDNRRRVADLAKGRRVLDLCCYTGGFAVTAKVLGGAEEVTGVDLDEQAIEQAKRNANLNQTRIRWVHADAFAYARQMQQNTERWDIVVLDPPKLIDSRDEFEEGRRKYEDLNILAMGLVKPGGLFVTCSCSGLLSAEEFERVVVRAAHRREQRLQFLDHTGAGADHPVWSSCPEGRYLKLLWARVPA